MAMRISPTCSLSCARSVNGRGTTKQFEGCWDSRPGSPIFILTQEDDMRERTELVSPHRERTAHAYAQPLHWAMLYLTQAAESACAAESMGQYEPLETAL